MVKKTLPFNQRIVVKIKDYDVNTGEDIIGYHCIVVKRYSMSYDKEPKPCGYEAIKDGQNHVFYVSFNDILDYRIVEDF